MSIQLGSKLADLRKRSGYSQEALAEKMGLSRQAVSKWERGESSPDTDTIIELSRLYGVSLDELVGNEQEEKQEKKLHKKEKAKDKKQEDKIPPLYPGLSKKLLMFPIPLVIIAIYVFSGLTLNLWHPGWLMILLIPAYYHFAIGVRAKTKKGLLLAMPVIELALILFLILGLLFNAWKWAWILFIAALCYYWVVMFYIKKE